jgi:hypothetical protein
MLKLFLHLKTTLQLLKMIDSAQILDTLYKNNKITMSDIVEATKAVNKSPVDEVYLQEQIEFLKLNNRALHKKNADLSEQVHSLQMREKTIVDDYEMREKTIINEYKMKEENKRYLLVTWETKSSPELYTTTKARLDELKFDDNNMLTKEYLKLFDESRCRSDYMSDGSDEDYYNYDHYITNTVQLITPRPSYKYN